MARYPIKMLKDEEGNPFVPLVSTEGIQSPDQRTLAELLDDKLETDNIIPGENVTITTDGNDITISTSGKGVLIDDLNTATPGLGGLDAHQGKVLKEMIPNIVDDVTSTSTTEALSANQGYVLNQKVVPAGGKTGQVLKKKSDASHSLEWGDAADPNAIVGDGSIKKIIEITYEDYKILEDNGEVDPNTEYHILDSLSVIDNLQETLDSLQNQINTLKNALTTSDNKIEHRLSNTFGNNTDIPLNQNFTCPKDGIVQFGGYGPTFVTLYVNGQAVEMMYCGNQAYRGLYDSFRVKKGDIVKITWSEGQETYANVHVFKEVLN